MNASSENIEANLFDVVRVSGKMLECNKNYFKIARADADISVQSKTFQVGDWVVASVDGTMHLFENSVPQIYCIQSISDQKCSIRFRQGADFEFNGGVSGERGFVFHGQNNGYFLLDHATTEQIAAHDELFKQTWTDYSKKHSNYRSAVEHCSALGLDDNQINDLTRLLKSLGSKN